jgi:hypothetical protein
MFAIICYSHRDLLMELYQGAIKKINNPITNYQHQDNHIWQELKNRNEWQELEEKELDEREYELEEFEEYELDERSEWQENDDDDLKTNMNPMIPG